jgi:hypothetical protein
VRHRAGLAVIRFAVHLGSLVASARRRPLEAAPNLGELINNASGRSSACAGPARRREELLKRRIHRMTRKYDAIVAL